MKYEEEFVRNMALALRERGASKDKSRYIRNYAGAKNSNLTADWMTTNLVADEILKWALPVLRARSRDLAMNNDYMKNFLRKLKVNVIGPQGIGLQLKARNAKGEIDKAANQQIEDSWRTFCRPLNASVCTTQSLTYLMNTAIDAIARDGEVLIRKVKGYDNPFRFSLQLIEADHLDEKLNTQLPNGNRIRMGIEKNEWGRPVAYYLFKNHPGDLSAAVGQRHIRIPADEIIHAYLKERPTQSRGVPWAHTAILRLRHLGAYEEAAVVNARIGASKMGFIIEPEKDNEYQGDGKDASGNTISEVEPGLLEKLAFGSDFKEFQTTYPNGEFPTFNKAMLRGIASGLGCSYNILANDLEGVNFSSLRSGLLEERDGWKSLQQWFITTVLDAIYSEWLVMAILSGQLKFSPAEINRLSFPRWQPRRWDWVDPLKDVQAKREELDAKLTSPQRICAEKGEDFEEIIEELKEAKRMLNAAGFDFPESKPANPKVENEYEEIGKPATTGKNGNGKNGGREYE